MTDAGSLKVAPGFAIGPVQTQPQALRHTEYHHLWADIQIVLSGEEIIHAGTESVARPDDEERKPDLFITQRPGTALPFILLRDRSPFSYPANRIRRCVR
jgi:hypothetical protein